VRLIHWRGERPNFGDELNLWLWPRLFGAVFDDDDSTLFLGIGSILGVHDLPAASRKLVFGAGFVPDYGRAPDLAQNWDIRFVRGPRTAQLLGLPASLALGDPGVLVRRLLAGQPRTADLVGFMPHWESATRGNWQAVCARAGVTFVDPTAPVEQTLATLLGTRLLVTEAMHGAIVADALRVPWVPVLPFDPRNRAKWDEWAGPLGIDLRPHRLAASSLQELGSDRLERFLRRHPSVVRALAPVERVQIARAAGWLARVASAEPSLSDERVLDRQIARMEEAAARLKREQGWG
jgi:succinoglycan biosynthesis protein ExoV